jgi:hypothetical protein
MNSRATGLIVRFLSVMTPTGKGGMDNFTGRILSGGRFVPKRNTETAKKPRKGPLAISEQAR